MRSPSGVTPTADVPDRAPATRRTRLASTPVPDSSATMRSPCMSPPTRAHKVARPPWRATVMDPLAAGPPTQAEKSLAKILVGRAGNWPSAKIWSYTATPTHRTPLMPPALPGTGPARPDCRTARAPRRSRARSRWTTAPR
ncbi:hypothetical protein G6F57_019081 [Rhizopus arrhizus]|nr:hypothetical protein G6F57_019081 [Rhizopus arrhizus]